MKKLMSKVNLCLLFILPFAGTSITFSQISTKMEWDSAFQKMFSNNDPLLDNFTANENGLLAWQAHYWIRAYISIAQTYNDTTYLNKAVRLIDTIFYYRDDARYSRGEINLREEPYVSAPLYYLNHRNNPAPGWRIRAFGKEWRIQTLDDGQITNAIMRFVDCVLVNENFKAYHSKAKHYITKVEETVKAHDSLFEFNRFPDIPGSYYYPNPKGSGLFSGTVPFNHNATMATTLLLLDKVKGGVKEYRDKAESILAYFIKYVTVNSNDAYVWNYSLNSNELIPEDFNHGNIDIGFFCLAYDRGLSLSFVDMKRFVNTLTQNVYSPNGQLNWFIDGTDDPSKNGFWSVAINWIDLAGIDPIVFNIARTYYHKHYMNPTWSQPFLGWAEILRWANRIKSRKMHK